MDLLLGDDFPLPLDRPFTAEQLTAAGIARRRAERLLGDGRLRRVIRGVYAAAQAQDTPLFRAEAIRLVVPRNCVVTDESAGWLAGAPMILRPGSHVEAPPVTVFRTGGHDRLRNGISASGTRQLLRRDVMQVHGVACTTPLRTALDLGRLRHRDRAVAALDQLSALGVFDAEELRAELRRFKGMRGVRQLRVLVPLIDARSESPGESALRLRFHDAGIHTAEPQREIFDAGGRFLGRVDLLVEELRFVAEYFGEEWHGSDREQHDRQRIVAMERAGYTVRVFWKHHVFGQHQSAIEMITEGAHAARTRLSHHRAA